MLNVTVSRKGSRRRSLVIDVVFGRLGTPPRHPEKHIIAAGIAAAAQFHVARVVGLVVEKQTQHLEQAVHGLQIANQDGSVDETRVI